jgi:DNA invertase Pin-like site-specific DNA recombinase
LQALLNAAASRPLPFDVVLTDDSSRIARDLADALRTMQTLKFHGLRVIYISQGIDSASEQADALVTMHGLVDQLYLKEMAKKIKRGLGGQLERGLATGSKTYGYRTVPVPSGKTDANGNPESVGQRRVVHEEEARVIRQIFEWAASGIGISTIVRRLQETVRGPWGKPWTSGVVRRILRNEVYLGRLIWGRVTFERQPGSNRRIRREQPRDQWKVHDAPVLRVVSDVLWQKVQGRLKEVRTALKGKNLARGRLPGYQSKYLFSGFLRCGTCGGAMTIVSCGKIAGPRYGCPRAHRHHNCENRIDISLKTVDGRLLERLQSELQRPEITDYIVKAVEERARQAQEKPQNRVKLEKELTLERRKLQNLIRALESGQSADSILAAISRREESVQRLERELAALNMKAEPVSVDAAWIQKELSNISTLLKGSAERTRPIFKKLNLQVRLYPIQPEGERPHLRVVATASLDALTGEIPLLRRSLEEAEPARVAL